MPSSNEQEDREDKGSAPVEFGGESYIGGNDKEKLVEKITTAKDALTGIEVIAERLKLTEEPIEPKPCPEPIEPKKWRYAIFVDAGHGTLKNGIHTTIAGMGRYWTHKQGKFHQGTTFYEGVSNRILAEKYIKRLEELGMKVVRTYSDSDLSLSDRVSIINYHHEHIQEGLTLSFHSNASPGHDARGIEYYTTIGETTSDPLAQKIWEETKIFFPNFMRSQHHIDGDADYEKNFDIIFKTKGPAVLLENFFFDHYEDALLLMDEEVQDKLTEALVKATVWAQENLQQ